MEVSRLREALQSYSIIHRGIGMLESRFVLPVADGFLEVMTQHSGGLLLIEWQHYDPESKKPAGFIKGMLTFKDINGLNSAVHGPYDTLEEFERSHPRCFQQYIALGPCHK